ncbi:hypothetical protein [Thalassobellus suaedae]|uniref:Uncharacterized protein n=1 Tax=Thalassobellus suaedae TaxID=3074124 RepID=A0ABY9XX93_9FLAO|nr:hypothetical protein RHP51_08030 [Flavobacteriaceae bacterium HL-DH14]
MRTGNVDVVRSSFTPTSPLIDGNIQEEELNKLNERLRIIDLLGTRTKEVLNSNHPSIANWFKNNY